MKIETAKWIHEARVNHQQLDAEFTRTGSMTVGDCDKLFKQVYEFAIKAPLVERFTGVPGSYQSHSLTDVSKRIHLWDELSGPVKMVITDMDPFYPNYPGNLSYTSLVSSSFPAQWKTRIDMGKQLIDAVEQIISDPARFNKLTF